MAEAHWKSRSCEVSKLKNCVVKVFEGKSVLCAEIPYYEGKRKEGETVN